MKIRGNTVGTTTPRPDWKQTDPAKVDFILNKPDIKYVAGTRAEGEPSLQELESGTYILNGSFFYNKYTSDSVSFNGQYVNISHNGDYTYLSYFGAQGSVVRTTLQGRLVTTKYIDLDKLESTRNRVDIIDSTSDDAHYPTAKAVYDYVGNMETAIDSIIAIQESLIGGAAE